MTQDEIRQALVANGFQKDIDEEYHWEVYRKKDYSINFEGKDYTIDIEVGLNYYNVQIRWYFERGHKVTKQYYVHRDLFFDTLEELIREFIKNCGTEYRVRIENYG